MALWCTLVLKLSLLLHSFENKYKPHEALENKYKQHEALENKYKPHEALEK